MKNEIEFKGMRTQDRVWVFGLFTKDNNGNAQIQTWHKDVGVKEYCVFPESVAQFTGLYDKKSTKIFNKDIVGGCGNIIKKVQPPYFVIDFENGGYNIGKESDTDYEVVGTFFNNADLLNEKLCQCGSEIPESDPYDGYCIDCG